jgi:hypothetical protein
LLETAQFIISVMQPGCFDEQRCGYITINKARLIHAVVRHMILQKSDWNKGWGVPINQEDMAGTNLAFSYIILKGMEQANYAVSAQEKEDFLFAWRFIGYQLHIDDQLLPENYHEAGRLAEKIQHRHFKPSEEGKQLTAELIRHYKKNFAALPAYFIDAQVRYFLGPDIYALLGMKRAPVKDALVRWSNKVKERINPFYTPRSGFEKMLRNHLRLRKKYS